MEPDKTTRCDPPAKAPPPNGTEATDEAAPLGGRPRFFYCGATLRCLFRFLWLVFAVFMLFLTVPPMFSTTKEIVPAEIEGVAIGSCLVMKELRRSEPLDLGRTVHPGETRRRPEGTDELCAALSLVYDRCGRTKRETVLLSSLQDGWGLVEARGYGLVGTLLDHVTWGPACVWGVGEGADLGVFQFVALAWWACCVVGAWLDLVASIRGLWKGASPDEELEELDVTSDEEPEATPSDAKV